ncbi:hypothetical protein BKK80_34865 (plasmid) [Cupriavidus malaysiensis]|uniref:Uncharacterized protein n=2 Tax=Cupriavidus malaysiensis TaxID=367825 RepID=A0ABN4U0F0_9BURK|nr:hypothetical protein BKK80_34865 [Cupriavidus malaysiensis]
MKSCVLASSGGAKLNANVTAKVVEAIIGDDTQTYRLDYGQLNARTKVTDFQIQVSESGLLTAFNTNVTDQSGQIIKDVGTTVANVARAFVFPEVSLAATALGPSANTMTSGTTPMSEQRVNRERVRGGKSTPAEEPKTICSEFDKAKNALAVANKSVITAKDNDKKRAAAKADLADLELKQKQLQSDQEFYKKYGTKAQLDAAIAELNAVTDAAKDSSSKLSALGESTLDEAAKTLSDAQAKLTFEEKYEYIPKVGDRPDDHQPALSSVAKLLPDTLSLQVCSAQVPGKPNGTSTTADCLVLPRVGLLVVPTGASGGATTAATATWSASQASYGLMYRLPATGKLRVTLKQEEGSEVVLVEKMTQVPQFGPIGSLNLDNEIFDDNLLKVAFNANGAPSQLAFQSKAQAANAAAAMSDVSQSYLSFAKARQQDRLDTANAQIAYDKSRAAADASVAADSLKALADVQRRVALATGTASADATQLESLSNQKSMLEAQLQIIKLQKQINDAKASLGASTVQQ